MLSEFRFPRFASLTNAINFQLHFFSDTSKGAYGSCCYVRTETRDGVSIQLLRANCKVAPLSSRNSIAWLELCAVWLSTQMFQKVVAFLKIPAPVYFWTDSTVTTWSLDSSWGFFRYCSNNSSKVSLRNCSGDLLGKFFCESFRITPGIILKIPPGIHPGVLFGISTGLPSGTHSGIYPGVHPEIPTRIVREFT